MLIKTKLAKFKRQYLRIFVPLAIKLIAMLLLFFSAKLIIDIGGLNIYGSYSQSLTLLMLFISLSSLGFAQSFIRKASGLSLERKIKLYNIQHRITFTNSILLFPLFSLILYYGIGQSLASTLVLSLVFLLISSQRIRFSYLRTSRFVRIAELPDMIIRHLIFIILLIFIGFQFEFQLHIILGFALFGAFIFQFIIDSRLGLIKNYNIIKFSKYKENIEKTDLKIWIYNSLIQLKEFVEITLIIVIINESSGGEYKLLMQFSLAFMAVFNSLNLINSFPYAEMIKRGDVKNLNIKAQTEMKSGLFFYFLIFITFIGVTSFFDIFEIFSLPKESYLIFYIILIHPLVNLLIGPLSQLNIHWQNLDFLNTAVVFKMFLIMSIGIMFFILDDISLLFIVAWKTIVELIFIFILSYNLVKKFGYIPPIIGIFARR